MMSEQPNKTSALLSTLKETTKMYAIFDAGGRIIATYHAPEDTAQGGQPCVVTRYGYRNASSSDILKSVESNGIWDPDNQGWDDEALLETLPDPLVNP
jgi:hypothetical protein